MRLGVCTGFENMALIADAGFDYMECALSAVAAMSEEEFRALAARRDAFEVPVERCNGFLPGDVKVTGGSASEAQWRAYLEKSLSRANALGVKVVVFGSGAARGVEDGWSHAEAWRQIARFLAVAAEIAKKYGVRIAIEPLRRKECNIVNYVSEATLLSALVGDDAVGALGDTFHMRSGHEPYSALTQAGEKLLHVHISHTLPDLSDRAYPMEGDGENYAEIAGVLSAMGYTGSVSIEAPTPDLAKEAPKAYRCLRNAGF